MRRLPLFIAFALAAWAHNPATGADAQGGEDPLRNTKKLAAEGHATLYRNGAFQVPMTTIHLIPPGPSALELAAELAGVRARASFQEALKHARESADVAKAGVERSVNAAVALNRGADAVARETQSITRFGGTAMSAAPGVGRSIIAVSVSHAGPVRSGLSDAGEKVAEGALEAGQAMSGMADRVAAGMMSGTVAGAGAVSSSALALSGRHASFAAEKFVKGYAAAPGKVGARARTVADAASFSKFAAAFRRSREWTSSAADSFADIVLDAARNYSSDIAKSFGAASDEIGKGTRQSGPTLAALKSLRWVLQGIFWDATIKPVTKMTAGTLGYIVVNGVAYPALITVNEGAAVGNIAVQVTWNSAAAAYDVTAPTATAAVVGLFSAGELVGGEALAGAGVIGGTAASGGAYLVGKTAAAATAGGGYVAGKGVQYVAAPLAAAGVAGGGTVLGVVASMGIAAGGAGVAAAGVAAEGTTRIAGAVGAGAVGAGGGIVSVATGAALGTYEVAKAVVVPAGHELGAGIVLSYATLSQLGAQAVLAVSDASYMVLSLEGPRWVMYAVKGDLDNGEHIPTGTVLDLKAMQQAGETLYSVPATDEEVKRAVDSVYEALPESKTPAEGVAVTPAQ